MAEDGTTAPVALIPVQWEEAKTLEKKFPDLVMIEDGQVDQSASLRSLFVGTEENQIPKILPEVKNCCVKTHLSTETYKRMGGLLGNRDLEVNDCLMAVLFTDRMNSIGFRSSDVRRPPLDGHGCHGRARGEARRPRGGTLLTETGASNAYP